MSNYFFPRYFIGFVALVFMFGWMFDPFRIWRKVRTHLHSEFRHIVFTVPFAKEPMLSSLKNVVPSSKYFNKLYYKNSCKYIKPLHTTLFDDIPENLFLLLQLTGIFCYYSYSESACAAVTLCKRENEREEIQNFKKIQI